MAIRVLLADDHQIVRQGLRALLENDPDVKVVGEAADGRQAVDQAIRLEPDIVVLDVVMPRLNGLEVLRQIRQHCPKTRVLVLSSYNDDEFLRRTVTGRASGYLLKEAAAGELLQAIRQVFKDEPTFNPKISSRLRHLYQEVLGKDQSQKETRLPSRETETLQFIAEGYANKQIAAEMGISIKTVEKHRQQIMHKLNIHEVAGLTRYAIERRMVESSAGVNKLNSGPQSTASQFELPLKGPLIREGGSRPRPTA
jgi:DNA-binding NarL/FixJ family response regulator